jgi:hypothetical protein
VVEREVDRTELYVADELFFVGAAWEVLPISEVDNLALADQGIGPVTRQIARAYYDLVRGIDRNYSDWRTSVYWLRMDGSPDRLRCRKSPAALHPTRSDRRLAPRRPRAARTRLTDRTGFKRKQASIRRAFLRRCRADSLEEGMAG